RAAAQGGHLIHRGGGRVVRVRAGESQGHRRCRPGVRRGGGHGALHHPVRYAPCRRQGAAPWRGGRHCLRGRGETHGIGRCGHFRRLCGGRVRDHFPRGRRDRHHHGRS